MQKWRAYFDNCAATGRGPFQSDMGAAWRDLSAEADDDFACAEAALWVFVRDYCGWGILEHAALDEIARRHAGGRIIDLGAGSGFVAACLRARGLAVDAIHVEDTWVGWWDRRFGPSVNRRASKIAYDADAYVMLMPDASAGEDLMSVALARMPVGATLYAYTPAECTGSWRGQAILRLGFERVGDLPMICGFPWESASKDCGFYVKRRDVLDDEARIEARRLRDASPFGSLQKAAAEATP